MKTKNLWIIIALLAGVSAFGIYKSLDMLKKNNDLEYTVKGLQGELEQTTQQLSKSEIKNSQLEADLNGLRIKLGKAEEELKSNQERIAFLGEEIKENKQVNTFLMARNNEMSDQYIRMEFENSEMRKTLASIDALKKAIADLRKRPRSKTINKKSEPQKIKKVTVKRQAIKKQPEEKKIAKQEVIVEEIALKAVSQELPPDISLNGNRGFVIKDGQSTLQDLVDIKVVPVEANVVNI